ncbi:MAG: gamma-glutamyl kinase [Peptococcaceae bacterium BRH_c4b]|nr:MAG: gamma-glutamyl kinase [Peptococcaceae bacterium BRH_c4b]
MRKQARDFNDVRRTVVKIGSSSLIYSTGKPNLAQMENLVRQMADIHNRGVDVLLVTSGAIGVGFNRLGYSQKPKSIPEKQAAAAVGQGMLMHLYEKFFDEYGVVVGQILLTREDFSDRRRFLNARNTMYALLGMGVIPVINENDTVAVDEIKVGDNDTLAAQVAGLVDADLLLLLSDIDGLYNANPKTDPGAVVIPMVTEITRELESAAGGSGSAVGTGGMATKLHAARMAMHFGLATVVAGAGTGDVIRRVLAGEELGTVFWPSVRLDNKKRWIAYCATVQGKLFLDEGAAQALARRGKSLLPSGITGVEGDFEIGNTVSLVGPDGVEIARGIVNYSAREVNLIKGLHTHDIQKTLGHKDYDEVVHRNNLVLDV